MNSLAKKFSVIRKIHPILIMTMLLCIVLLLLEVAVHFLHWYIYNFDPVIRFIQIGVIGLNVIWVVLFVKPLFLPIRIIISLTATLCWIVIIVYLLGFTLFLFHFTQEVHVHTTLLNNHIYHLMLRYDIETPAYYLLYECDQIEWECNRIARSPAKANYPSTNHLVVSPAQPTYLLADRVRNVLYIWEGDRVIYEYPTSTNRSP